VSIVTRIFIVLTLILSVFFLAHIQQYYHIRENYKAALIQSQEDLKNARNTLKQNQSEKQLVIDSLNRQAADKDATIKNLYEKLSSKDREIAQLENVKRTLKAQYDDTSNKLNNALANASQSSKRIQELEEKANRSQRRAMALQEELELATDIGAREEEQKLVYRNQVQELHDQLNNLQDTLYASRIKIQEYADTYGNLDPTNVIPIIKGKIVGVKGDTVVINRGANHGVKVGFPFSIRHGNKFVGKVRVEQVEDDLCVAFVMKDYLKGDIQELDDVSTR
jgi:predicted nuclease with TOPRIM domain